MVRRRTQEERSEETRERLLTAAVKILSKRGYASFRIAEVSDLSGVSRGGMLHHYRSKDELVAGVLDYLSTRIQRRAKARIDDIKDLDAALLAIVDSGAEFFFGVDFPIYLDLVLAARQSNSLMQTARALARRHTMSITDVWTAALVRHGLEQSTATQVVDTIWSLMRGLAIKAIGNPDGEDRDRTIGFALEAVHAYLANRGQKSRKTPAHLDG